MSVWRLFQSERVQQRRVEKYANASIGPRGRLTGRRTPELGDEQIATAGAHQRHDYSNYHFKEGSAASASSSRINPASNVIKIVLLCPAPSRPAIH